MSQEEMDECGKRLAEKMEKVLEKYKVQDSKRDAYRGRGSFLEYDAGSTEHESGEKIVGQ